MKKILISLLIIAFLVVVGIGISQAANPATVTISVTIANLDILLSETNIDFGVMALSSEKTTSTQIVATNNSNTPVHMDIQGFGDDWTIADTIGTDQFVLQCNGGALTWQSLFGLQRLQNSVPISGTVNFDLKLLTPSSDTYGTTQQIDVQVSAVLP